jgi:mannose-6-phosphate isomerase-like protein (cupin superfamily)
MASTSRPVVLHPNEPMPEPPGPERRHFHDPDGRWVGWAGWIQNEAGDVSGWHHHAANDTHVYVLRGSVTVEFGPARANGSSRARVTSSAFRPTQSTAS